MALLDDIRTAVRVSPVPVADASGTGPDEDGWEPTYSSDYDGELQDLVDAAFADMLRAGVRPALLDADDPDKLVKLAVKTYAKAHFGYDNQERGEFVAAYERILVDLKNAAYSNVEHWRVGIDACEVAAMAPQRRTGRALRPVPEVSLDGEALEYGRDFVVWYADNVEAGTATAFVQGTGSYKGTVAVEFEVVAE